MVVWPLFTTETMINVPTNILAHVPPKSSSDYSTFQWLVKMGAVLLAYCRPNTMIVCCTYLIGKCCSSRIVATYACLFGFAQCFQATNIITAFHAVLLL